MSEPTPALKVTQATPNLEKNEFITKEQNKEIAINEDKEETVTKQPEGTEEMKLYVPGKQQDADKSSDEYSDQGSERTSFSEQGSGYERDANECTEFCIECISCFGLFNACCPATGEGFLTNVGVFCGTILVGCCKC